MYFTLSTFIISFMTNASFSISGLGIVNFFWCHWYFFFILKRIIFLCVIELSYEKNFQKCITSINTVWNVTRLSQRSELFLYRVAGLIRTRSIFLSRFEFESNDLFPTWERESPFVLLQLRKIECHLTLKIVTCNTLNNGGWVPFWVCVWMNGRGYALWS